MAITITSISPTNVSESGSTTLRVVGTNLDTVTTVLFNDASVPVYTIVSPTALEFASSQLPPGNQTLTLSLQHLTDTAVVYSTGFKVYAAGTTPAVKGLVYALHTGTVDTEGYANKAPWIQQAQIMKLKYSNGSTPISPMPVYAPLFNVGDENDLSDPDGDGLYSL